MLIHGLSQRGRGAAAQYPAGSQPPAEIPTDLLRAQPPCLPEVSELDAVRHYTHLSQLNYSIDTHFYPLGSCTMKYNPRVCNAAASLPQFLSLHLVPECLLIEPSETASKETLDRFVAAMKEILQEALMQPQLLKSAPHTTPVRRVDEVRAPDLAWRQ